MQQHVLGGSLHMAVIVAVLEFALAQAVEQVTWR